MSIRVPARRLVAAGAVSLFAVTLFAGTVGAHETRVLGEYRLTVGMIGEPVFTMQKSGLEFRVVTDAEAEEDRTPVEGLADTLQAEVTKNGTTQPAEVSARFGAPGWYQSYFFPTEAGPYTFRVYGTIDGTSVDETYTAGSPGEGATGQFGSVEEQVSAEFPAAAADSSSDGTSDILPLGLAIGAIVIAVIALGVAFVGRRRAA